MTSRPRSRKIMNHFKNYSLFDKLWLFQNISTHINNLQNYQKHYEKELGLLGRVKFNFHGRAVTKFR